MDTMDPGSPGGRKKGSIFAGLAPAPAPIPAPAPMPAPRPAADADSVMALKQKIDALEKNIVFQLEKKITEQFKANSSAPPPASPAADTRPAAAPGQDSALLLKIVELERRLGDFSQQAVLSASQMRNIEESKISARREIEDLLKAVREQQKYSEIDRQMHAQLEKSWGRVEELEKKLMNFYASVLTLETRRKEDLAAERGRDQASFGQIREMLMVLARRMDGFGVAALEKKLMDFQAAVVALEMRHKEELIAGRGRDQASFGEIKEMLGVLARRVEAFERITASAAPTEQDRRRELEAGLMASSRALRAVFEDYAAGEITRLGQKFSAELETFKTESSLQAASLKDALAGFSRTAQENKIKADGVEAALGAFAEKLKGSFEATAASMLAGLKKDNDERFEKFGGKYGDAMVEALAAAMLDGLKKDNDEKFRKFNEKYAQALTSLSFLDTFQAAACGAAERLAYFERIISAFVKSADRGELDKALGVSGMLKRDGFADMEAALGQFRAEKEKIEDIRAALAARCKDIFGGVDKP